MFQEYKDIQEKFNRVVEYSQNLPKGSVDTSQLFEDWAKNKEEFIEAWDGKLIKELGKVEFHLSENQRLAAVDEFIERVIYICEQRDVIADSLLYFINSQKNNFFDNIVHTEYATDDFIIPKGMKILKAFKFFISDKELLNEIQSIASMMIQSDKISGILCMSVHPLDYLSVSENAHNWRTCHALDGEYRAGNLNYMTDNTTIVCYIMSKQKYIISRFPEDIKWNSKKWRVLLYVSNDRSLIMMGRQYPFQENLLLELIKTEASKMFDFDYSEWIDDYHSVTTFKGMGGSVYTVRHPKKIFCAGGETHSYTEIVMNEEGTLQFNDLLDSSVYLNPYYAFALRKGWDGWPIDVPIKMAHTKIKVGHKCKCLICNKKDITMSESFLCPTCMIKTGQAFDDSIFGTCWHCGNRFVLDDGKMIEDLDGCTHDICEDCYNELLNDKTKNMVVCPDCECLVYEQTSPDGRCSICREESIFFK